jgi:hypothetical protein
MSGIKSDNPSFVLHAIDTVKYEDVSDDFLIPLSTALESQPEIMCQSADTLLQLPSMTRLQLQ